MRRLEVKHSNNSVSAGACSAGVISGDWLYISGQGPLNVKTGKVVRGTIEAQTRLTLTNIADLLAAADCTLDDVIKCTCHLRDIRQFDRFNRVYAEFFAGLRPARTTVQSTLWGGIGVEIDAIARIAK
jgi:2-iminobutanoate/2-iminopropanoate deaminase